MAIPKIFVSSTCYDLHEIRLNLKNFISEFGYDPIMSEFGDIFYDPTSHVQDSCVDAIKSCDLFILIIGNNYGSIYYGENKSRHTPDSVTVTEFKKALSQKTPRITFINKYVLHDYRNYKRHLNKKYTEYFSQNTVSDGDKTQIKLDIKIEFDQTYPFSNIAHQYVFYFLDQIDSLEVGNSFFEFENSDEIKLILKKQWAGFLYNALKASQEKLINKIDLEKKTIEGLERLDNLIKSLTNGLNNKDSTEENKLVDSRKLFDDSMNGILYDEWTDECGETYKLDRVSFHESLKDELGFEQILNWVNKLNMLIKTYKWSQFINTATVFEGFNYTIKSNYSEIPLKYLEQLNELCKLEDNKNSFAKSVQDKFSSFTSMKKQLITTTHLSDDVPF